MNAEITALVAIVERWQRARRAVRDAEDHDALGMAQQVLDVHEAALLEWSGPLAASRPAPAPQAWPDCPDCGGEVLAWSDTVDGSSGAHCTGCGREFFAPLAAPAPAVGEALEDMRHGRVQSLAEIDAALASPAPQPADGVTQAQHEIVASIIDMVEHDQSRRAEMNRLRADALRAVLARALASGGLAARLGRSE